ncbi:8-amino-7-oxononanoate synthase [Kribbella orskensis]|uniref:8-amino-7-oxononanoate synthase n=1 Tax=Kribbella orskensis TaxID=2512216 RepID=A0ABY2BI26_9ACTN|nr:MULTISPECIES: 8-amino-7-oxononanoate synthase [Kribbella]TCN38776.1 8-amino-7-oxononanoate synthase [Kribbella sp. VKM Ac-2500]TCO20957.1 8-amino-7-oxononanoate synthase [Kribbella orskensis]
MLEDWLAPKAAALESRGLTRRLRPRASGEVVVDLASNDYLGLARDPRVVEAAVEAVREWGASATASRLVTGTTALHAELESELAAYVGQETGLAFSSGYLANLGVITALGGPGTLLVSDDHVHASMVDACRLSRSRVEVTPHNDVEAVAKALAERNEPRAVVLVESVYSVLGDAAPLTELAALAVEHDAVLLVDEAHGLGVTGNGRGSVAAAGLAGAGHVIVTMTLSKALASQGGVVLGPSVLRDHLINRARAFIFDTGLTPAACGAALAALRILSEEPSRPEAIHGTAARLAAACGVTASAGPVVSVPMPGPREAVRAADLCLANGVRVGSFRPPSVPDGISRLRLTAHAGLSTTDLDRACDVITTAIREAS